MSQASTVRAIAAGQGRPRDRPGERLRSYRLRRALLGATAVLLIGAGSATAQQYGSVGASVTVDYGVLDSLGGNGGPNLPAMLSQGGYPQQSPYAASPYAPVQGQLLAPPSTAPRSTLTTAPMAQPGVAPGQPVAAGGEVIRLIPPSQIKKSAPAVAAAPAAAPAPAPTPQPAAQPVAPPPPTEIAETPAATPPAPPSPPAPAAAEPAPSVPEPTQQAATPPPPPPAPESPAAPAPAAESAQAAAEPEPAPPPAPPPAPGAESGSGMSAGGALTDTGLAEAGDAPEQSLAEAEPASTASEPTAPAAPDSTADSGADSGTDPAADAGSPDAQTAALPPQSAVEGQVSIGFAEGASELTPEAKSSLDGLADRLRGDESLRIQLLAYAVAIDDNTSRARRMSLSRALAVRAYLIEKGVRSTRMDVRALGSNVDGEPADKVDIIPQAQ